MYYHRSYAISLNHIISYHIISYHVTDLKWQNRFKVSADKLKLKVKMHRYQMMMSGKDFLKIDVFVRNDDLTKWTWQF